MFAAAAEAGVRSLLVASSVGVYSPSAKEHRVDESWPRDGVRTSFYARHKAEVERRLDALEAARPDLRVVRMRPALTFKREAASGIRRLFLGPLFPGSLLRPSLVRLVPDVPGLVFQAVHTEDVAEAYRLAIHLDEAGPFNLAAEPLIDSTELARLTDARTVRVPAGLIRAGAALTWRLRLQPSPPGWVDLGLGAPLMDATRAHEKLMWRPQRTAIEAIADLVAGLRDGSGIRTPPLAANAGGPARIRELATGVGGKDGA